MTASDQRVIDTIAAGMACDGWTCEYHEPDATCGQCRDAHQKTATRILAALRATTGIAAVELPEQHLGLQNDEDVVAEFRCVDLRRRWCRGDAASPSGAVMSEFNPGDVIRYRPTQHHCHEGQAIINEAGVALDTFWWYGGGGGRLTDDELTTAELEFSLADYVPVDGHSEHFRESQWEKYAPKDRALITSQHGLQRHHYLRKGAVEDWPTQIGNARERLAEAERKAEGARRAVEWAREDLDRVITAAGEAVAS